MKSITIEDYLILKLTYCCKEIARQKTHLVEAANNLKLGDITGYTKRIGDLQESKKLLTKDAVEYMTVEILIKNIDLMHIYTVQQGYVYDVTVTVEEARKLKAIPDLFFSSTPKIKI